MHTYILSCIPVLSLYFTDYLRLSLLSIVGIIAIFFLINAALYKGLRFLFKNHPDSVECLLSLTWLMFWLAVPVLETFLNRTAFLKNYKWTIISSMIIGGLYYSNLYVKSKLHLISAFNKSIKIFSTILLSILLIGAAFRVCFLKLTPPLMQSQALLLITICMLIYGSFCYHRPGLHLIKISWLLGLFLMVIFPTWLIICSGPDKIFTMEIFIPYRSGKAFPIEMFSQKCIIWVFSSLILMFVGQELFCKIARVGGEKNNLFIKRWQHLEWSYQYKWLFFVIFTYAIVCIYQNYKYSPHSMLIMPGINRLNTTTKDIPIFAHPLFYSSLSTFLSFLYLKILIKPNKSIKNIFFLITIIISIILHPMFTPTARTFLFTSISALVLMPGFYIFLTRKINIWHMCLACLILYCSFTCIIYSRAIAYRKRNPDRPFIHKSNGLNRLKCQPTLTFRMLNIENKPKVGLLFTKRSIQRLFGINKQYPSLGNVCCQIFFRGKPVNQSTFNTPVKDKTSSCINYIGQMDFYFGNWGLLGFIVIGFIIAALDYYFQINHATISLSIYIVLCFSIAIGKLSFSMLESSLFKSGCIQLIFLAFFEHKMRSAASKQSQ